MEIAVKARATEHEEEPCPESKDERPAGWTEEDEDIRLHGFKGTAFTD